MRIVVTGGGTGGHVYPALEVARLAQEDADLTYMGSLRGMEGGACEARGIRFQGFDSRPVYSVASFSGLVSLAHLFRASILVKKTLAKSLPDVVFSTGGYSSAPVMRAAKSLGIPLAIHACDTVPGRSLRMFADYAKSVTSTFEKTASILNREVLRTGHPIREELRQQLLKTTPDSDFVVILGGSGGAKFLNEIMPKVANRLSGVRFLHSAGKNQFDEFKSSVEGRDNYEMVPYLESDRLISTYKSATLVVARSGAGISEYAMSRIPSILIPLPSSADDHQFHNAKEFATIGGSSVLTQDQRPGEQLATESDLAEVILAWLGNPERRQEAARKLAAWDKPDATVRIWNAVKMAARK